MKKTVGFFILSLLLSKVGLGQNVNLIIQVNDKLVESEISNIYVMIISGQETKKALVNYWPGDLIIDTNTWSLINSDTSQKISLHFDYNTYDNNNHQISNFYVDLTRDNLKQRYLILNIYDFRDKRYKKLYQWHTDKDFLAELKFPFSGLYIREK